MKALKWLQGDKDGGPKSQVKCWGLEIKGLLSILLLRFDEHTREEFHNHAFNCVSWLLTGELHEEIIINMEATEGRVYKTYYAGLKPILTYRNTLHRVYGSVKPNWVLTFRGPWNNQWKDYEEKEDKYTTLTHGRKKLNES